jgi:hypothetical protein
MRCRKLAFTALSLAMCAFCHRFHPAPASPPNSEKLTVSAIIRIIRNGDARLRLFNDFYRHFTKTVNKNLIFSLFFSFSFFKFELN